MAFMNLYTDHFKAYRVETRNGDSIVPCDVVGTVKSLDDLRDYCEGEPLSYEIEEGWFARYSAPGYLDCTDWCGPFKTEGEAVEACKGLYGNDDESEDSQ